METITLILFGLTVACFFISLMGKGNRNVNLLGAVFGALCLSAFLIEPWGEFSLVFSAVYCVILIYLAVGVMIGDNSE